MVGRALSAAQAPRREREQPRHIAYIPIRPGPHQPRLKPQAWARGPGRFNQAVTTLYRVDPILAAYGLSTALEKLFQGKVKARAIRRWRQGTRAVPSWARDILTAELRKHLAELEHALALLAEEAKEKAPD